MASNHSRNDCWIHILFRHQPTDREGVTRERERVQRIRQPSCVVLALKKAGFYRCGVRCSCFVDVQDPKIHRRTQLDQGLVPYRFLRILKGGGGWSN